MIMPVKGQDSPRAGLGMEMEGSSEFPTQSDYDIHGGRKKKTLSKQDGI